MARPGLIAALLLPLPFAALPLVAVLMGGPTFNNSSDTVYVPITSHARDEDKAASMPVSSNGLSASLADELRYGCDDYLSES